MEDLKQDHEIIYLQEVSWDDEGRECDRLWCQEDEFDAPTKYIRADLYSALQDHYNEMEKKLAMAVESIETGFTKAYNAGVVAGMLKDKADHCVHEATKQDYLERMGHYQNKFKELHRQALTQLKAKEA